MYYDTFDPFVALTAAAAVTSKIKLATGICLVIQRDPIHTAKEVASLDQVSNGRFLFGIGAGWNIEEMNDHGTPGEGRFKLMRERIEAMKEIWSRDEAEYHGDRVDFPPMIMNPKPVQKPHPPIHVGGVFPGAARRAIRYGDAWIPIGGRGDVSTDIAEFRSMAKEAGRDGLEVSLYGVPGKKEIVEQYRDAGADRGRLPPQSAEAGRSAAVSGPSGGAQGRGRVANRHWTEVRVYAGGETSVGGGCSSVVLRAMCWMTVPESREEDWWPKALTGFSCSAPSTGSVNALLAEAG